MARYSKFIDEHLHTKVFEPGGPPNPYHRNSVLLIGNEMASRLRTDLDEPGDFGRLAHKVSQKLGIITCGYERLGSGGRLSPRAMRTIMKAMSPGDYPEAIADIGTILKSRLAADARTKHATQIILVGKSGGAMYGTALARDNTVGAHYGVFMDPAGMHDMGGRIGAFTGLMTYKRRVERHKPKPGREHDETSNAEPTSLLRQLLDIACNGAVASTDQTLTDLKHSTIPVYVDIPQHGMYCEVPGVSLPNLVSELNNSPEYPQVIARLRPDVTHDWYNGSPQYAQAVRDGLSALGHWGIRGMSN